MEQIINVSALYKEAMMRKYRTLTYLKLKLFLEGRNDALEADERAQVKAILSDHLKGLPK